MQVRAGMLAEAGGKSPRAGLAVTTPGAAGNVTAVFR